MLSGSTFTVTVEHDDPDMAAEVARAVRMTVLAIGANDVDRRGATITATQPLRTVVAL